MAIFQVRRFVFSVYVFECFILVRVGELVVKAVYKFTYKQVLVSICQRSIASKALKGFCWFLFIFNGTLLRINPKIIEATIATVIAAVFMVCMHKLKMRC